VIRNGALRWTSSTTRWRVDESTRRALWAYLFISPFYLSFLAFGVFPIVFSFYLALTRWTPYQSSFIGLANFGNLFQDKLVHTALFNFTKRILRRFRVSAHEFYQALLLLDGQPRPQSSFGD